MPVAGRKPKDGPKRNRMPAAHDWIDVEDKSFRGKPPVALPDSRRIITITGPLDIPLLSLTTDWWKTVSSMPHCRLWKQSDWVFALETALVADQAFSGTVSAFAELRMRSKVLGTTADARRDLRIRYVTEVGQTKPSGGNVVELDPRRNRLLADAT